MAKIAAVLVVCVIAGWLGVSGWWVADFSHPLKALATAAILIVIGTAAAVISAHAEG